jgi:hypothetical protein
MVDRRAKREEFRAAVNARDPFVLAQVLNVPRVSPVKGNEPKPPKETLQEGGTDWSNVLNAWLGACEAAEAVSYTSKDRRYFCIGWIFFGRIKPDDLLIVYLVVCFIITPCSLLTGLRYQVLRKSSSTTRCIHLRLWFICW